MRVSRGRHQGKLQLPFFFLTFSYHTFLHFQLVALTLLIRGSITILGLENVRILFSLSKFLLSCIDMDCNPSAVPYLGVVYLQITDLLVNITKHELKPKHRVLTNEEKQELLKKYSLEEKQVSFQIHFFELSLRYIFPQVFGLKLPQGQPFLPPFKLCELSNS